MLRGAGLMDAASAGSGPGGAALVLADPDHPLLRGVEAPLLPQTETNGWALGDSDVQVVVTRESDGAPVVAQRDVGAGTVILIGFDFTEYDDVLGHTVDHRQVGIEQGFRVSVRHLEEATIHPPPVPPQPIDESAEIRLSTLAPGNPLVQGRVQEADSIAALLEPRFQALSRARELLAPLVVTEIGRIEVLDEVGIAGPLQHL